MRVPFFNTCRVPASLEAVTTRRTGNEVNPRAVHVAPEAVARIWRTAERLYACGVHPAIQLCVRRGGHILIDRAIGHASGNGPQDPPDARKVLATPETPFNVFSTAKAVTSMILHLLDERNLLRIDDRVCEYIPEFGVHHKEWITIRHLLTHRAGIPNLRSELIDLDRLREPDWIVQMLCDEQPLSRAGRQLAYHAISGGFILGEVVRRVMKKDIRTVLNEVLLRPLGFRWTNYGVRRRDIKAVATNYFTGLPPFPPVSIVLKRAFGVGYRTAVELSNDPRFLTAIVPSANLVSTANELSRFFQLLLNKGELDGVRVFDPRTVQRATAEQSYLEMDFTLGLPIRYATGFMLGSHWLGLYGPATDHAFGHLGFSNILAWADPEREVAAAIVSSGKPLLYPGMYYGYALVRAIGEACSKVPPRKVPVRRRLPGRSAHVRPAAVSGRLLRVVA